MLRKSFYQSVIRLDLGRTIAGRGRYWTTAYYVDSLLIDTGCAHTAYELVEALQKQEINQIVNTHSHEDHIGANGILQRERTGLEILAHPLALPLLADPRRTIRLHPYRKLFWGWPEASQAKALEDGEWIETDRYRFQVIYTPGHSPDHVCLYEEQNGWLFTGDLYVGGRDRALGEGYNIWQIIASLKRVASLTISVMFPGCARTRPVPSAELNEKIHYLEDFGERVLGLRKKGWEVKAIVKALCGPPIYIEAVTLGNFSRKNLVLSYLQNAGDLIKNI